MAGATTTSTVLVVDDEQRLRDLVRGYLEHAGFSVLTAADGQAALQLARQHAPEVVVLDLMLPGLDGLEVCRRLRTFSDAYVIMLTARAEEIDRIVGLEVGADDYVNKPFVLNLAGSGRRLEVPADKRATDVLLDAGISIDMKCSDGICGRLSTSKRCSHG